MDPVAVLRECGYEYRGGRLLQVGKDEGFQFQNQEHYDKLADAVLRYIEVLLYTEGKLKALYCPVGATAATGSPIYVSDGFERASKLLLIIQGSGRVRVGVWGCALCINKDLDHGTMLPYIRQAEANGYGLVILNPNLNEVNGAPIPGSESPERHVCYVWQEIVMKLCNPAAPVDIVAHSNGGRGTLDFLRMMGDALLARIRKIVFTDSYHSIDQVEALSPAARKLLAERSVNYVPHSAPFGTPVPNWVTLRYTMEAADKGCPCLSCAVDEHASTNHGSLAAAFQFFAKP
jgi:hypothetical protein